MQGGGLRSTTTPLRATRLHLFSTPLDSDANGILLPLILQLLLTAHYHYLDSQNLHDQPESNLGEQCGDRTISELAGYWMRILRCSHRFFALASDAIAQEVLLVPEVSMHYHPCATIQPRRVLSASQYQHLLSPKGQYYLLFAPSSALCTHSMPRHSSSSEVQVLGCSTSDVQVIYAPTGRLQVTSRSSHKYYR